jgi:hypothetical protein
MRHKLIERPRLRINLQHKQIITVLAHTCVDAGVACCIFTGVQPNPIYGTNGDTEFLNFFHFPIPLSMTPVVRLHGSVCQTVISDADQKIELFAATTFPKRQNYPFIPRATLLIAVATS